MLPRPIRRLPSPAFGRRRLKVGFTVSPLAVPVGGQLWANGMGQNVVYLAMLLQRMAGIDPVMVVPDQTDIPGSLQGLKPFAASDVLDHLDILIELGVRLDQEQMARFRQRGGRLVSYMAGNAMAMNFESVANRSPTGEIISTAGFDAVWITPQHFKMNEAYCRLTRSDVVRQAPHIWHPWCLMESLAQYGASEFFWNTETGPENWRIGIFDPTINVVKTFHLPLLVCEEVARRHPLLIERVLLFCATRFAGNPHFEELAACLDLGKRKRLFIEDRHPLPAVLGKAVDAVVTHQWENNLNYLYWDVLYSGRPLVHNSPAFADAGYYYRDFDPRDGARVCAEALRGHGSRPVSARSAEIEVLWDYSIDNPHVHDAYAELFAEVMEVAR